MLKPDIKQSIEFLKKFHPDAPWALTAISTDRKIVTTRTFFAGQEKETADWIKSHVGEKNIYFHVNLVNGELAKKAEKGDINAMHYLHVDIDPRAGEDFDEERVRALGLLTNFVPKPTFIIDSGGGYQGFWRLAEPFPTNGEVAKAEEAERYNIQLEKVFGADNCHNVDRIMRLPGTLNVPDAKKKKKGRKLALASVVEFTDASYPFSMFTAAPKVQTEEFGFAGRSVTVSGNVERLDSVDDLNEFDIPDWLKVVIVQGKDPDNPGRYPSRSEALFAVTCELVRKAVPDQIIFSVLMDPGFAISESVLENKRPEKYALRQIERAHEDAIHPMLRTLNEKHAVIGDMGGKCRIISEVFDAAMKRHKISRQSFEDFKNRYRHIKIEVGHTKDGQPIHKAAGGWWVDHPQRRQYETLVFAPGQEVPDAYNLWKGFAVDAVPGKGHELFLEHVRQNICNNNPELYSYVVRWMARAVQKPDTPGEVALVLRGKMGTGKSFFAKVFGKLFGRHFLQISDPKHLVGSFNAHLRDTVVLFADEAFYAGDKKHESILRTLITEELIMIEGKGLDAEAAPNYTHTIMASNKDWVVPAGAEERRFLITDVGEAHMQDKVYFKQLKAKMENEKGYESLLHFLMTLDLTDFEVRDVPKTGALRDQKMLSLSAEEEWWYEKIHYGRLLMDDTEWKGEVQVKELQDDYIMFMQRLGFYRKLSNVALGKFLQKVCPVGAPKSYQKRADVKHLSPDGYVIVKPGRPYFYVLPPLEELRAFWDKNYGGPYPWQEISTEAVSGATETKKPF